MKDLHVLTLLQPSPDSKTPIKDVLKGVINTPEQIEEAKYLNITLLCL